MEFKHDLGLTAKDKITGFEGLITGRCDYLTGCNQYLLQPPVKDGDFKNGHWFDEGRIELTNKKGISSEEVTGEENGACGEAPIK